VRNAYSITNTHTYGYANFNPAAYSYTERQSNPEAASIATPSPKPVTAIDGPRRNDIVAASLCRGAR
jgi:hypothetical protein